MDEAQRLKEEAELNHNCSDQETFQLAIIGSGEILELEALCADCLKEKLDTMDTGELQRGTDYSYLNRFNKWNAE